MSSPGLLPTTVNKASEATSAEVNRTIRMEAEARIDEIASAGSESINRRLRELDREWDVERMLEANAATIGITGIVLGATVDKRFLLLPAAVAGFLLQHALQGWCPPLPPFRKLGVRTAREIEEERHALKVLRGDYNQVAPQTSADRSERVRTALEAVCR